MHATSSVWSIYYKYTHTHTKTIYQLEVTCMMFLQWNASIMDVHAAGCFAVIAFQTLVMRCLSIFLIHLRSYQILMSFGWAWRRSSMSFNRTLLDFRSKVLCVFRTFILYIYMSRKSLNDFFFSFNFNLKSISFSFYFDFVSLIVLTLSLSWWRERGRELLILAMSKSLLFQPYVFIIFSPVLDCFQPNLFHIVQACMCVYFVRSFLFLHFDIDVTVWIIHMLWILCTLWLCICACSRAIFIHLCIFIDYMSKFNFKLILINLSCEFRIFLHISVYPPVWLESSIIRDWLFVFVKFNFVL